MRFITQAAKVLNEQKKSKRRLAVFMCLAAVVALGTVAALKMYGQAMSHKEKRLVCTVEAHRHTDACYDADGNLVCGQADYLVHTHNDDCYGADGELVCHLPEIEAHTHTDACYTEEDVLVCTEQEQAHQHTDACYTPQRGELTCQMEEHTHGDDCYDSETGELTCQLEEHQHGDACYAWEEVLTCPYAAGGHQHNSDCYTKERGELTCPLEEHTHGDDCYDENGELTCQIEEHTHDDNCYAWEDVLTCQLEETPAGHTHTDACYEKKKVLTCGQLELHTHTEDCYDENGALACGLLELKEHTHQEECFETVELTDEEVAVKLEQQEMEDAFQGEDPGNAPENGTANAPDNNTGTVSGDSVSSDEAGSVSGDSVSGDSISTDKVSGNSVSGDEIDSVSENDADVHEHDETCYDAAGGLMCGYEDIEVEPTITQTYEDDNKKYVVTAVYKKDANIPENAELKAEMITAESDEEYFAKREAEMKETLQDEDAKMDALFKIGFYVNDKEVEPESDVMVTVQFLDDEGLADGTPMTIVHFGEDGNEVLGGSHTKDRSTTFKTNKFSDFAALFRKVVKAAELESSLSGTDAEVKDEEISTNNGNNVVSSDSVSNTDFTAFAFTRNHQTKKTEADAKEIEKELSEPKTINVSGTYKYESEAYNIDFHINGNAVLTENTDKDTDDANGNVSEENISGDDTDIADGADDGDEGTDESGEVDEEETEGDEVANTTDTPVTDPVEDDGASADASTDGDEETPTEDDGDEAIGTEGASPDYQGESILIAPEPDSVADPDVRLVVRLLSEQSKQYSTLEDYAAENSNGQLILVDAMDYSLTCNDESLDISNCKISAEIKPKKELNEYAEEAIIAASEEIKSNDIKGKSLDIKFTSVTMTQDLKLNKVGTMDLNQATTMSIDIDPENETIGTFVTSQANPNFTVQYYANLDILNTTGTNALPVIDTSGKRLPKNGKGVVLSPNDNEIKNIYVDDNGKVLTTKTPTEVYTSKNFEYIKAPSINYMDVLVENTNYKLSQIWVLKKEAGTCNCKDKEGKPLTDTSKCTEEGRWDIYNYSKDLHFTNRSVSNTAKPGGDSGYIFIPTETEENKRPVIRFLYDVTDAQPDFEAAFYDYDITSGRIYSDVNKAKGNSETEGDYFSTSSQTDNKLWYVYTKQTGINSDGNYTGKTGTKLAFGNVNTGTTYGENLWGDGVRNNLLNKYNGTQSGHPKVDGAYKGCTFGLVTGLSDGKIQYAGDVAAPNLFNEGDATGKTSYDNKQYSLKFLRNGDTYTLTAVNNANTTGLEAFNHPVPGSYKDGKPVVHTHIWTNNFWPMDAAASYGTDGHDMKFGSYANRERRAYAGSDTAGEPGSKTGSRKDFPYSDDGKDHNSYFGMQYKVQFELSADYVGPLEYYFFGDDDMWVFLDDRLVCDIGGVHSSVGEYVNLWDYLQKGSKGKHTLSFFYTERGASGSTCWMQFTLPSVSTLTPEKSKKEYGELRVEKTVTAVKDEETSTIVDNKDEFTFTIRLTDKDGKKLPDDYSYVKFDKDGEEIGWDLLIWDGGTFNLKNGEYIIIKYLPADTKYKILESDEVVTVIQSDNKVASEFYYYTDITVSNNGIINTATNLESNKEAVGDIISGNMSSVSYNNKFNVYELPHTGGFGPMVYTIAGAAFIFISLGAGFMYRKKSMKGGV